MFKNQNLEFPCPACGAKNTIKVGDVESVGEVTCPGCGDQIKLESEGFNEALGDVDKAFADLEKAVSDINKRGKRG